MRTRIFVAIALALAIGLAAAASPYASARPDGLNRVAADSGFDGQGQVRGVQKSPAPGYAVPGVRDERLAKGLAGFAGTVVVFAVGYGMAWGLRRRRVVSP